MLILGRGLGVRWDPLHLQARRLEAVQRRADQAEAQTAARVDELLKCVEASHYADRPVGLLSGGEHQRLRVGQALADDPVLLLCD